jgi:hypothetical protein
VTTVKPGFAFVLYVDGRPGTPYWSGVVKVGEEGKKLDVGVPFRSETR